MNRNILYIHSIQSIQSIQFIQYTYMYCILIQDTMLQEIILCTNKISLPFSHSKPIFPLTTYSLPQIALQLFAAFTTHVTSIFFRQNKQSLLEAYGILRPHDACAQEGTFSNQKGWNSGITKPVRGGLRPSSSLAFNSANFTTFSITGINKKCKLNGLQSKAMSFAFAAFEMHWSPGNRVRR